MSGVADGLRTTVASPQAGWLRELKVYPYQLVNRGDPIAIIEPVDARVPAVDLLAGGVGSGPAATRTIRD